MVRLETKNTEIHIDRDELAKIIGIEDGSDIIGVTIKGPDRAFVITLKSLTTAIESSISVSVRNEGKAVEV